MDELISTCNDTDPIAIEQGPMNDDQCFLCARHMVDEWMNVM